MPLMSVMRRGLRGYHDETYLSDFDTIEAESSRSLSPRSPILTWTADNLLRHAVYVGLREDRPADQVRGANRATEA